MASFCPSSSQHAFLAIFGKNVDDAFGHVRYLASYAAGYFVLHRSSRVLTLVLVFFVGTPAWVFLGVWFLYQLVEADFGLLSASANGGRVAFFAHVGGSCSVPSSHGSSPAHGLRRRHPARVRRLAWLPIRAADDGAAQIV